MIAFRALVVLMGYFVMGTAATLRHIWLAMMLRPDWRRIADSGTGLAWFGGVYLVAAMLRWWALGTHPANVVLEGLLLHTCGILLLFARPGRSSALVFLCWGASAGVDLLACGLIAFGVDANTGTLSIAGTVGEAAVQGILAWSFFRLPAGMRKEGYGRKAGATLDEVQDAAARDVSADRDEPDA